MTASLLTQLIHQAAGLQLPVFQYSKEEDFEALWCELNPAASGQLPWSTAVILWDGTPRRDSAENQHPHQDPGNTASPSEVKSSSGKPTKDQRPQDWLTPWDWALVISLHLHKRFDRIPAGGFRCLILDLLPPLDQAASESGRRRFKRAHAFVPWVRWYRPLSEPRPAVADYEDFFRDLGNLSKDVPDKVPVLDSKAATARDLGGLGQTWSAMLTAPSDRHTISNLVGPIVLAEGIKQLTGREVDLGSDRMTLHLRNLLRWSGLIGDPDISGTGPSAAEQPLVVDNSFFPQGDSDIFDRFQQVRFLLVDDQFNLGYHRVLANVLFGEQCETSDSKEESASNFTGDARGISLRSVAHPDLLLNALQSAIGLSGVETTEQTSCSYCSRTSNTKPPEWDTPRLLGADSFDILLLDLRLFGSSTVNTPSDEEKRFLAKLLTFYHHSGACRLGNSQLKDAVDGAAARAAGGKEDLYGLTLLPLLLSYADPSLPIVLFSSTHQRAIVEALGHRPSIITTFSKPIISGYSSERSASDSIKDLKDALGSALRLHETRVAWEASAACKDWGKFPIFEVEVKAADYYAVYNHQIGSTSYPLNDKDDEGREIKRKYEGLAEPLLRGIQLRKRLKEDYCRYLLREHYLDYLSIPWEFLEGVLMPTTLLNDPRIWNPQLRLSFGLDEPDNHYREVFSLIRNKKVHGRIGLSGESLWDEDEWNRKLTILLFLMLIDFIMRSGGKGTQDWNLLFTNVVQFLLNKYPDLSKRSQQRYGPFPRPRDLTSDTQMTWSEFALLVMLQACRDAHQGNVISPRTAGAMERIAASTLPKAQITSSAGPKAAKGPYRVVLRDLPNNIGQQTLEALFAGYGKPQPMVKSYVDHIRGGGQYWKVIFLDEISAEKAIQDLAGSDLNGFKLKLEKDW